MERAIITRTSSKGNALEIGIACDTPGGWYYYSTSDGKRLGTASQISRISTPVMTNGQTYTHGVAKVAVHAEEIARLEAAMSEAREAYRTSPEGLAEALREERRTLQAEIRGILDETEAARERGYNEDIGRIPSYDSPKYRAATHALADFDAAHPEITAALEHERQERIARTMWD